MLEQLLALDIYHLGMVFARISGAFLALPGFAASYVQVRIRLFIAIGVSIAILPLVIDQIPPPPGAAGGLVRLIAYEITVGVFVGVLAQMLITALHFAGTVAGLTSGLANAFVFDPVSESQGALITGFLNLVALVLIFVTGIHMVMLEAVAETFSLFPPGGVIPTGDMADYLAHALSRSFAIGLRLASPFIVFSIVFQTAMGVTARLMPQMNVFFVGLPAQILLGLSLLMLVLPTIMLWFMTHYEDSLRGLFAPVG
ncbi:flagellar biosynthetic protein FliR [Oleispirillum naphthae]|uniref:flagellar biosynthetic protein FliR n=1 Tax=Oleispirillum naphthae TaxID=2838853 RepID=UPI003082630C